MANDIRDILKGLSPEFAAIYAETRTNMRRAYLYAHSKLLPIEQYEIADDAFLDLMDIKIAELFDRSGSFNHAEGHLNTERAKEIETAIKDSSKSEASKILDSWTSELKK